MRDNSAGEQSAECRPDGAGLPSSVYIQVAAQWDEWSKHMLIGCLGTRITKARKRPDKDGQKDILPEILTANILHKCLLRMLILLRLLQL